MVFNKFPKLLFLISFLPVFCLANCIVLHELKPHTWFQQRFNAFTVL